MSVRIALISDIHGNADALRAVLNDARAQGVDRYAFLGDMIFDMPFSGEVLDIVRALPEAVFVRGNKEHYLDNLAGQDMAGWTDEQMGVIYQTYRELDAEAIAWLRGLPDELTLELPSGRKLHCLHAIPQLRRNGRTRYNSSSMFASEYAAHGFSRQEYLDGLSRFYEDEIARECAGYGADAIAYGHDHIQGWGMCAGSLVVDAGSAGIPLDCDARAAYTILEDGRELRAIERRVGYDVDAAIARARNTSISRAGAVWSALTFRQLRTAQDCVGSFFAELRQLEAERPDMEKNARLHAAYERLKAMCGGEWVEVR